MRQNFKILLRKCNDKRRRKERKLTIKKTIENVRNYIIFENLFVL